MRLVHACLPIVALSVAGCTLLLDPDEYRDGAQSHAGGSGPGGGSSGTGGCTGGCGVVSATAGGTGGAGGMGPGYEAVVMADRPVAYWRLGDAVGSATAKNIASQMGDGSYQNVVLGADGLISDPDTAASFSGSLSSYLDVGTPFVFSGFERFTLEAWLDAQIVDSVPRYIFDVWNGIDDGYRVDFDSTSLRFLRQVAGLDAIGSLAAPMPSEILYVVAVYDGSNVCIYANAGIPSCSPSDGNLMLSGKSLSIGYNVNGVLDEVAVYARELTPAQIDAHFAAGTR